jgi:hypothetical protein
MNAKVFNPSVISKEQVADLHFPAQDVLNFPDEIKLRKANAQNGLILGNAFKTKVRIFFEDSESTKQVITTIWGLTDLHVILKGGITIPLHRIYSIDMWP